MKQRINYYGDLVADYSRPEPVLPSIASRLIEDAQRFCWAITGLNDSRPSQFSNGPNENQTINTYVRQKD